MPTWPVHLKIANKLAQKYHYGDDFIIGNVIPDTMNGYVIENPSNIFHHTVTHYSEVEPLGVPKINISKFLQENKQKLDNELILGTYVHILADLFFNEYTMKHHTKEQNNKLYAVLKNGNLDKNISPMTSKQNDFKVFGDSLIKNKEVGNIVKITKNTLSLSNDLNYQIEKEDIIKTTDKINEIVNEEVLKQEEYQMFTEEELIEVFNNCYEYIDKQIHELIKNKGVNKMLDKKYNAEEKEQKWIEYWNKNKIYEFKKDGRAVYSIDTPPPTVSGNIHIGHIFSYSQTEMLARYKRLRGYNIFYPFGFDDNGLPSERLVEKEQGKKASEIGRESFSKLCYETTDKYEEEFKNLFSKMGVSTDWNICYKTVSPSTIKISQLSFLDLIEKDHCYHKESPALWCNECLTSIAQAELETKTLKTTFNYINYETTDGETFTIATTRPELIPAIVCVFVNPEDEKHNHLIGKTAHIPVLDIEVPIMGDEKVAIDKGTGVVMCCTFGDQTDIEWWKKYNLPLKHIFTNDGRIKEEIPNYGGMKIKEARKKIIEDLQEAGYVVKIEELEHEVQTHERCGKEVEYSVMKQWFIDTMSHKKDFLKIGNEIKWHPAHMQTRYNEWVENIMWDWCISRQRYFGVPFPVWYCKDCGKPVFAKKEDLPVNPLVDKPKIDTCPNCNSKEFVPETDVMDTWATSSVTPLVNMKYGEKDNFEDILKPMSLRTNASEIIRTWDFYTIVKSYYHFGKKPWDNVMISGFVMASKGEKISKSKGNSKIEPIDAIKQYSADVVRYWAGTGRLGTDIVYSDETLQRGKKLINKIWNVSKFIEMHLQDYKDKQIDNYEYIDRWILGKYNNMEKSFLKYLDEYEVGLALNTLEKFFWNFCDNYIEIVKHRLYRPEEFGEEARYSGQKTVYTLLYKLLQDFSIYFPFITEEIYQTLYHKEKSIHITEIKPLENSYEKEVQNGDSIIEIISTARGAKTDSNVSLKTPIKNLDLSLNDELAQAIKESEKDFKATLFIDNLIISSIEKDYKINKIELDLEQQDRK